jgi:hypothetical protein
MGRSIGSLGTPREPITDLEFDFFGIIIRVNETASDLDLVGFMLDSAALGDVELNSQKAMIATSNYLRGLIHPDDWDTFWRQARANRQNMEDLMALGQQIVEAVAEGFPTMPSSESGSGQESTPQSSRRGSSSPGGGKGAVAKRPARRTRQSVEALAIAQLPEGRRGDLGEFFVQAAEVRSGA